MKHAREKESGFSLVELLIYIAIFAVTSTFLVAILTSVTRIQLRQTSVNTINRQIQFISELVGQKVNESSVVDMELGTPSSELLLRMPSESMDRTRIYLEDGTLFLEEGEAPRRALTPDEVVVDVFQVTKFENPGGRAVVQATIGLSYDTESPRAQFSRVVETAITKISAASFDSHLLPSGPGLNIGDQTNQWKDGYFSGSLGIGISPGAGLRISIAGDAELTGAGGGIRLRSPNGTCYKIVVNDAGGVVTEVCP